MQANAEAVVPSSQTPFLELGAHSSHGTHSAQFCPTQPSFRLHTCAPHSPIWHASGTAVSTVQNTFLQQISTRRQVISSALSGVHGCSDGRSFASHCGVSLQALQGEQVCVMGQGSGFSGFVGLQVEWPHRSSEEQGSRAQGLGWCGGGQWHAVTVVVCMRVAKTQRPGVMQRMLASLLSVSSMSPHTPAWARPTPGSPTGTAQPLTRRGTVIRPGEPQVAAKVCSPSSETLVSDVHGASQVRRKHAPDAVLNKAHSTQTRSRIFRWKCAWSGGGGGGGEGGRGR